MDGVLIRFGHGLGDCVQFTVVLRHLLKHRPNWEIDLQVSDEGNIAIFRGFERVRAIWRDEDQSTAYVRQYYLEWAQAYTVESDGVPATKAERCLREVFGIEPEAELCFYIRMAGSSSGDSVTGYLRSISGKPLANGRFPVVIIHCEENSAIESTYLTRDIVARLCDHIIYLGFVPLILGGDSFSELSNRNSTHFLSMSDQLHKGFEIGDGSTLADLIEKSSLFIGFDGGPQKVAFTTATPMICLWGGVHPIHSFPFAVRKRTGRNETILTRHLVPSDHAELVRGDRDRALQLFSRYDSVTYCPSGFERSLIRQVRAHLNGIGASPARGLHLTVASLRCLIPNLRWTYRRVGLDERELEFTLSPVGRDFRISRGAAGRESTWNCLDTPAGPILAVYGEDAELTFRAIIHDGKFVGQWLKYEQCGVELIPDRPFCYSRGDATSIFSGTMERFSVGIPTYNCYDLCARLIDSVFKSTVVPTTIYVIDNGEGERHFSFPDPRVSVFRPLRNLGVARSWNLLHRFAAPDPLIILNDDIVLGANCLEALINCGAAAATLDNSYAYEAFLLREEIWNKVGEFDEHFYPAYFEDNDHARRLILSGYAFQCPPNDGVSVDGRSSTRSRMSAEDQYSLECAMARNGRYYCKKWGGPPGAEAFVIPASSGSV